MTTSTFPVPNFAAIPADMRDMAQWVCWRSETVLDRDGNYIALSQVNPTLEALVGRGLLVREVAGWSMPT